MYFLWAGRPLVEHTEAQGCDACEVSSTSSQKSLKRCFNEINKSLLKSLIKKSAALTSDTAVDYIS